MTDQELMTLIAKGTLAAKLSEQTTREIADEIKIRVSDDEERLDYLDTFIAKNISLAISSPPYFTDDEICGYCERLPGEKHKPSCRQ